MLKFTRNLYSRLFLLSAMAATTSQAAPTAAAHMPPQLASGEGRAALVMIEFVNEWLAPEGKLRGLIKDERQFAYSQIAGKQALEAARRAGMPVIHATLQMSPDYRELGRARFGLRGAIPKAGTWQKQDRGWQFYGPFAPQADEFVLSGRAGASAFAASDLDNYLRGQGITRLYLAGYATHVCIESTMRAAHDLGYEPVILSDATSAFTAQQQQHVLSEVVHHFGWDMPTQNFVDSLAAVVKTDGAKSGSKEPLPLEATSTTLRTVSTPGQEIPGISGAAVVQGDLVLLSGHVPVAADGSVASTLEGQLEQAFKNLDSTLRHAGSAPDRIARMTLYVRGYQPEQLDTIRAVRDRWLNGHEPASALIGVEALFRPDVQVEIDAIATLR
ncbi:Nicotinamidase/isochorismatase family protein [Pseudomonas chlororaphis subsp. aureofaciens]|uniref:isochorismatase family protein n=1 Tax=Pseudomonas chlororaphis TaxID=587753 RepID=UPI000F6FD1C3|nr:isochorismatase family protein [Pseudomonas chlororaphis]AZD86887.1 Nicotinamidase/isochorismatase family protein [Pseudomonas chlororaphis subsp. aureofaciens]